MRKSMKKAFSVLLSVSMLATNCASFVSAADAQPGWAGQHTAYFYEKGGELVPAAKITDKDKTEATCQAKATIIYKAFDEAGKEVGKDAVEIGELADHKLDGKNVDVILKEATCTEEGLKNVTQKCTFADHNDAVVVQKEVKIPAKGHTPGEPEKVDVKEATCDKEGSYTEVVKCSTCGTVISSEDKTIPAGKHDKKVVATTELTCKQDATETWECTKCDATGTDVIAKADGKHVWVEEKKETSDPNKSCTEPSTYVVETYCSRCDERKDPVEVTVPATGHTLDKGVVTKKPTCGVDGERTFTCTVCKEKVVKPEPATGEHKWGEEKVVIRDESFVAPTCIEEGYHKESYVCSVCGEYDKESVDEFSDDTIDHTYVYTTVKVEPTCTEEGIGNGYCSFCGKETEIEQNIVIPALGHTKKAPVRENGVEATCTKDGHYDEVVYCSVCDEVIESKTVTVEAYGHDTSNVVVKEAPVCGEKDGVGVAKCPRCKEDIEVVIEAAEAHDYKQVEGAGWVETCGKDGKYYNKCTICGNIEVITTPATGKHTPDVEKITEKDYVEVVDVKPTCTKEGSAHKAVICSVCKQEIASSEPYAIEALGHTPKDALPAALCEKDQTKETTCKVCGEKYTAVVEAAGHKFDYVMITPDTCTTVGEAYGKCKVCGYEATELEVDEIKDHAWETTKVEVFWNDKIDGAGYVVVTQICKNDVKHKDVTTEEFAADDARVKSEVTAEPTCQKVGTTTYTYTDELADGTKVASTHTVDIPVVEHAANTEAPKKEKVVEATCEKAGSYETVVYCVGGCGKEYSRSKVVVPALGHKAGEPVKENENAGTDVINPSYELVTYCTVCGKEISRKKYDDETKDPATGHVAGPVVIENVEPATCTKPGKHEEVRYCVNDGKELSRVKVVDEALGHDIIERYDVIKMPTCTEPGSEVQVDYCKVCGYEEYVYEPEVLYPTGHYHVYTKNVVTVAPTCTTEGERADVTYCGICYEVVAKGNVEVIPAAGHKTVESVENEVAATCTQAGSYDKVTTCTVCGNEVARETIEVAVTGHKAVETIENEVAGSCTEAASYDKVTTCAVCGEELSRETVESEAAGHVAGKEAIENLKEATNTTNRTYDKVVRCTNCGEVLSKTSVVVEKDTNNKLKICGCNARTLKASNLKKAAKTFKVHIYSNGDDKDKSKNPKFTFKKVSGSKNITVASDGTLKVKKGTKKGTYKVTIKVTSSETPYYKQTSSTKTITIKVK